ncbi:coenzyme Q-binding protein COQ10 homolog B, mitochondrial isoform X2 [Hydra vulgaris]|uniref:coenzyme Q-binding protein COQ10 homolog B, mitochondrial isoform X2 n=1 Tax=Hydra vulgaris TaxID=6087 RepID=UPI001F5E7283|nr:coenzyme Q-binding protein COQ10 homolog B, mitochondrial isoform X2 [Hydra vulgaris]
MKMTIAMTTKRIIQKPMLLYGSKFFLSWNTNLFRCYCRVKICDKLVKSQQSIQKRNFFGFSEGSRTKEYSETKVLGYTKEQLFDVVANVDDYKYFVPWCRASKVFEKTDTHARADIEVGFPPVSEKYTSVLTLVKPNLVKSECMDGVLFNHLICNWKISNGPSDIPNSCTLNFYISFEFKSLLHSHLSTVFFDEVVRKMMYAFENRCASVYGPSSFDRLTMNNRKKKKVVLHIPNKKIWLPEGKS